MYVLICKICEFEYFEYTHLDMQLVNSVFVGEVSLPAYFVEFEMKVKRW
jgi:hypothetical protein